MEILSATTQCKTPRNDMKYDTNVIHFSRAAAIIPQLDVIHIEVP